MLDTLHEYLLEKPDLYLDEMAVFLWDKFEALSQHLALVERCLPLAGQRRQPAEQRRSRIMICEASIV